MSMLGSVALGAAERLERTMGPRVALRSYKALFGQRDAAVVADAVRGALRCALALEDHEELCRVAEQWAALGNQAATSEATAQCRQLLRQGRGRAARILADAEVTRSGSGRAWYLAARVRDQTGDREGATKAFERAAQEGEGAIVVSARAALLERALHEPASAPPVDATEVAKEGSDAQKLLAARALLRAASKFKRAAGLSILAEVAEGPLRREAVALAAHHADGAGASLSWVEAERIDAVLSRWPDESAAAVARRRLAHRRALGSANDAVSRREALCAALADERGGLRHAELADAVAAGGELDPDVVAEAAGVPLSAAAALSAVHAIRRGLPDEAVRPMAALKEDPGDGPAAWVVAQLALAEPTLVARARELVTALLAAPTVASPPLGWSALADALERSGNAELAERALRRGAAAGDTAAKQHLAASLAERGWHAYEAGDHATAEERLGEAKRLLG
jgi:hypothetical protein